METVQHFQIQFIIQHSYNLMFEWIDLVRDHHSCFHNITPIKWFDLDHVMLKQLINSVGFTM